MKTLARINVVVALSIIFSTLYFAWYFHPLALVGLCLLVAVHYTITNYFKRYIANAMNQALQAMREVSHDLEKGTINEEQARHNFEQRMRELNNRRLH